MHCTAKRMELNLHEKWNNNQGNNSFTPHHTMVMHLSLIGKRILFILVAMSLMASYFALPSRAQSLRVTLRQHPTISVAMTDSITAEGDTIIAMTEVTDTTAWLPLFSPDSTSLYTLPTASFMINYRPVNDEIKFQSQYTTEARHAEAASWLTPTARSQAFGDPNGLSPMERAQMEYIMAHPEAVHYTWQELPDPSKDIREGRLINTEKRNHSIIQDIFTPEAKPENRASLSRKPEEVPSPWTFSGQENLQFSQLLVSNWIKGGENSVSLLHDLRIKANYAKGRTTWENSLINKIGFTYTQALKTRVSDDALDLSSKYGFNAVNKWYYSFLYTFKTQLFRNYSSSDTEKEKPLSKFMSPAYMQLIVGMDYKRDNLSLLLSPYTGIVTVVADTAMVDQTKYGIEEGRKSNFINGFSITFNWKKNIVYGIDYTTRLEMFYEYFRKDGDKRFDWENVIDVQINRFLSTRLLLELRYFDNESNRFQVKEHHSISFRYTF